MRNMTCATCRCYSAVDLTCRSHPPTARWHPDVRDYVSVWPVVQPDGWCDAWIRETAATPPVGEGGTTRGKEGDVTPSRLGEMK